MIPGIYQMLYLFRYIFFSFHSYDIKDKTKAISIVYVHCLVTDETERKQASVYTKQNLESKVFFVYLSSKSITKKIKNRALNTLCNATSEQNKKNELERLSQQLQAIAEENEALKNNLNLLNTNNLTMTERIDFCESEKNLLKEFTTTDNVKAF
ncbi:hypothetical protein RFI_31988 [Reticulomyxa filosa]|uniref:Viral A-type inclusion protein n=1 Tax=Reticulomyxa filosa TaxID=46433 RepID=X6LW95_RETFI|nr:hypothetical protein RFI_31988 [Reticulomyxa filosa]|eukprot:ETO05407.1 hypothetical protein RFI_31988 [Reticulomyxa filosa]